jgi:hypothetical protein
LSVEVALGHLFAEAFYDIIGAFEVARRTDANAIRHHD